MVIFREHEIAKISLFRSCAANHLTISAKTEGDMFSRLVPQYEVTTWRISPQVIAYTVSTLQSRNRHMRWLMAEELSILAQCVLFVSFTHEDDWRNEGGRDHGTIAAKTQNGRLYLLKYFSRVTKIATALSLDSERFPIERSTSRVAE